MRKRIFFLVCFLLVGCNTTMRIKQFSCDDLSLSLRIDGSKTNLYALLTCKNTSKKTVLIPEFYIDLNDTENGLLKNNWLIICDDNGNEISYHGDYCDPSYDYLEKQKIKLGPNESIDIEIKNISLNYNISNCKKIYISYEGPLGKSNEIDYTF